MWVDDGEVRFECWFCDLSQPVLTGGSGRAGPLGPRVSRHESWQQAAGNAAECVCPCATKKASTCDLIHRVSPFHISGRGQHLDDSSTAGRSWSWLYPEKRAVVLVRQYVKEPIWPFAYFPDALPEFG